VLHIRLFGGLEVDAPDGLDVPLSSRSSRHLLAFLALNPGRFFQRDVLAGTLWGERPDDAAQKALRNTLWRLRAALGDAQGEALRVEGKQIALVGDVWIDTREFTTVTNALGGPGARVADASMVPQLERAVELYRGDLLDGVHEEWTMGRREHFRLVFLAVLERLFAHQQSVGQLSAAIVTGRMLLRYDPFLERIHRELMVCHWAMGDRPLAVRQYLTCEAVLREELDLEPMSETRALHERIRADTPPRARSPYDWAVPS
jgi:DNA-binding SARP family transcriptional activator